MRRSAPVLLGTSWQMIVLLLVLAGALEIQRLAARRLEMAAQVAHAAHQAGRIENDGVLADRNQELVRVLARFDVASAEREAKVGERDETQTRADERRSEVEQLRGRLYGHSLRIVDQGIHLNELVLCLKAGERAFNALSSGDRATAEESLRSADAECRSSSEFLASRASPPADGATAAATSP